MKQSISQILRSVLSDMGVSDIDPEVITADSPQHGEYTTNVAMRLTKILKKPPMAIAQEIVALLEKNDEIKKAGIEKIEFVNPGFINFFLSNTTLIKQLATNDLHTMPSDNQKVQSGIEKKTIMVEFAHPNTHKAFHIGHLRNIITGECIVRLLEVSGHTVIRANYQGDVGLHIAKALYGLLQQPSETITDSEHKTIKEKTEILSRAYVTGNAAYEENGQAKIEINELNKKIYAKDPSIYPLYEQTRAWSLEYFSGIYKRVGSHFDRLYFESQSYDIGKKLVTEFTERGVFEKSEGAIIFPGEKYGLHNRVFITSEGNPTYEGKDVGLAKLQFDEYHPDLIIHCVASEQIAYFRVIFEAIKRVFPETEGKEHHLVYGWVRLKEGKMSSRSGNVVLGEWLLDEVKKSMQDILKQGDRGYSKEEQEIIAEKASMAAVKYAFLKVSTPQEIAFDIKESININGDSGPYLLYAYARCMSILEKNQKLARGSNQSSAVSNKTTDKRNEHSAVSNQTSKGNIENTVNQEEHDLARLLLFYQDIVISAGKNYAPNMLCTYLFNLAQAFNLFYAKHPILENTLRITLTKKTAETLQHGLYVLGIPTVDRM